MKFFQKIRDSIYNPAFYKNLPKTKLESALSYFFILIVVLSFIQTVLLAFPVFTFVVGLQKTELPKLVQSFPANLQVKITNGIVTTNAKEPYFISTPPSDNTSMPYKNILVIDTKDPYSSKEFTNFDTMALLTKDSIFYKQDQSGVIRSYPLSHAKNLIIDRQHLTQVLNKYSPLLKFTIPVILVIIFLFLTLTYLIRFIYLFFLALIIFVFSKLIKPDLTYNESYLVGLHTLTLGLLAEVLINITYPLIHFHGIPFMVTIISVVIYLVNFKTEQEKK